MVHRKGEACSRDRERASPLLYSNYSIGSELVAGEPGNAVKALLQVGIGGDVVAHLAIVELLVGHHLGLGVTEAPEVRIISRRKGFCS